jgi:predicted kinase
MTAATLGEHLVREVAQVLRVEVVGQRAEAHQVDEHDADAAALALDRTRQRRPAHAAEAHADRVGRATRRALHASSIRYDCHGELTPV